MNFYDSAVSEKIDGRWHCVRSCGACCHIDPADRPDLERYLMPSELELYLSMVGDGGWCVNYDRDSRECRIYADRPRFCRVSPENFQSMFGIESGEFNEFAIACCRQQIAGVYGEESPERDRYDRALAEPPPL